MDFTDGGRNEWLSRSTEERRNTRKLEWWYFMCSWWYKAYFWLVFVSVIDMIWYSMLVGKISFLYIYCSGYVDGNDDDDNDDDGD